MKFTKEDAFKQIEGYLTDNGKKDLLLSKRSVNSQLDTLIPILADEETELSAFIDKVKPLFQTMYGNLKYDTTQFVKKWQEQHPEKPEPEAKGEESEEAGVEDVSKTLLGRLEKLEAELARRDLESAVESKRQALAHALAEKGVKSKDWIDNLLAEVNVTKDTDIETSAEKYLKLYNQSYAETPPNVTPNRAGNGKNDSNPFGDVKQIRMNREGVEKGTITTN